MSNPKRYLVTSALPYANGELHLGHLAGAYLPADIYVRYLRLQGRDVAYICGSDEHGAAITLRSKKEGISPKDIIDKYHDLNKKTFERLGISFDYYHRTSAALHHETARDFFKKLLDKGDQFDVKESEQYYDEEYNQFLADRYIIGTCPNCGHDEAYGDQCENCGKDLSPTELINPKSTLSRKTPILKNTKHWFFKLGEHQEWLERWIVKGKLKEEEEDYSHHQVHLWKNHVIGQCKSWLDSGLHSRAITRDLDWGIPVPVDGAEGKVLYVWFDAPIGYISATKQWALENGKNWEDYWKEKDSKLVHFIGKDNIVFHCIVFPAMLKAHGEFILPDNVPANQFLNFEGRKFSKSKNWGIEQREYLDIFEKFENKEDALRFALIRNFPENRDADFKWDDFINFHDNELVANIGNFINRVVVLTNKYFNGKVPDFSSNELIRGAVHIGNNNSEKNEDIVIGAASYFNTVNQFWQYFLLIEKSIESYHFKDALMYILRFSSIGNKFLQANEPWKIYKEGEENITVKTVINLSIQIVNLLGIFLKPFLPFTSDKIKSLLNLSPVENGDLNLLKSFFLEKKGGGLTEEEIEKNFRNENIFVKVGHQIGEPQLLFAKINDKKDTSRLELIEAQKAKLAALLEAEKANERAPVKDEITFDDFTKLDIRTGTIIEAEKMKKADKLLLIKVDLGFEQRTVISGIAKFYKPEDIIGQQVLVVANLAPRKMRGVESQGMILMAENEKGELSFVSPSEGWGNGFGVS